MISNYRYVYSDQVFNAISNSQNIKLTGERTSGKIYYSVPNLKFNRLAVNGDHTSPKLDSNGEIMHWLKPLVCELQQQTRFSDSC